MSGFAALQGFPMGCSPARVARAGEGSYGPLQAAGPDLALPPGFQYRKFGVTGSLMSDGFPTPAAHDGMAAFPLPNGNIRLIRNHEVGWRDAGTPVAQPVYDPRAGGGTTSLEIDPATRELVRDFVSLSGTAVNCAGGPTPWGSWLSCEETVVGPPQMQRKHGYVFEVPVTADGPVEPVPLKAMGRFAHEAAAVDPTTGVVYLTEDQGRAGFYRFLPVLPYRDDRPGDLAAGGELQMLAVHGRPNFDTGHNQVAGGGAGSRCGGLRSKIRTPPMPRKMSTRFSIRGGVKGRPSSAESRAASMRTVPSTSAARTEAMRTAGRSGTTGPTGGRGGWGGRAGNRMAC